MGIAIIGAGPVGCYLGYLLAKAGYEVDIFEEHGKIGEPVQCTGIITNAISKILRLKREIILNRISKARIVAPEKSYLELPLDDIVIGRRKFDIFLAEMAEKAGSKIHLNCKFVSLKDSNLVLMSRGKRKTVKPEIIIGADGPQSKVAKAAGLFGRRQFYIAKQATVKGKFEKGVFEVFIGSIAPGFFGWVVPESGSTARVGLASHSKVNSRFSEFLSLKKIKKSDILSYQAGLIPIYQPGLKTHTRNIYIVGDAACQVKATTGGGIIPGLRAARILSGCISNKKDYDKELKKQIGRELWLHLRLRKILNTFDDEDYNKLVGFLNSPKSKSLFRKYNRDQAFKLMLGLVSKNPKLLYFLSNFLKSEDFIK